MRPLLLRCSLAGARHKATTALRKQVVIVDDDAGVLAFLCDLFESAGFKQVITYSDPLHAFREFVRTSCPDLIVTDYRMARLTGVDLLNELALLYGKVNAIIITGDSALVRDASCAFPVLDKGIVGFGRNLLALAVNLLSPSAAKSYAVADDMKR